jgi:hypothetical protein
MFLTLDKEIPLKKHAYIKEYRGSNLVGKVGKNMIITGFFFRETSDFAFSSSKGRARILEKNIVNQILKHLKTLPECFSFKEHGGMYGRAGLPDIMVCYRGRFVAFEVKTATGRLTKLQEATLRDINDAGGCAYKVTSLLEVNAILANLDERMVEYGRKGVSLPSTVD